MAFLVRQHVVWLYHKCQLYFVLQPISVPLSMHQGVVAGGAVCQVQLHHRGAAGGHQRGL